MNSRKITALLLSSAMALSVLTGCGGVNKDKTVATLNGEPVKLGVANFAARFGQAGADDFYTAYFGKNVWTSDLYGNGTTGQDNFKDSVMDSLEDMYVLQLHMDEYNVSITDDEKAAITAAAAQYMEAFQTDKNIVFDGGDVQVTDDWINYVSDGDAILAEPEDYITLR